MEVAFATVNATIRQKIRETCRLFPDEFVYADQCGGELPKGLILGWTPPARFANAGLLDQTSGRFRQKFQRRYEVISNTDGTFVGRIESPGKAESVVGAGDGGMQGGCGVGELLQKLDQLFAGRFPVSMAYVKTEVEVRQQSATQPCKVLRRRADLQRVRYSRERLRREARFKGFPFGS